ncbi:MAG: hypothetical protein JO366_11725, partial [Methylobacteriaceae bacterium]|nr:hypothetical protein [Methylobacteriaceae bacterium]MBV9245468.1 hypothetical protein [Methylobacteriaceae bacterium]
MPKIVDPHPRHPAVKTLMQIHADYGGKILRNKEEAAKLADDMRHVEAVVRMFDPEFDLRRIAVRRRQQTNPWFKPGTMFRAVLDMLKRAEEPLTVREITRQMLAGQGVDNPEAAAIKSLEGGVRATLNYKAGKA